MSERFGAQARIDAHNQILVVRTADQEASTFDKALATGIEYERQTAALLLRLELIRNDLAIKVSPIPRQSHNPNVILRSTPDTFISCRADPLIAASQAGPTHARSASRGPRRPLTVGSYG